MNRTLDGVHDIHRFSIRAKRTRKTDVQVTLAAPVESIARRRCLAPNAWWEWRFVFQAAECCRSVHMNIWNESDGVE